MIRIDKTRSSDGTRTYYIDIDPMGCVIVLMASFIPLVLIVGAVVEVFGK